MRVYVAATLPLLRAWLDTGEVGPAPFTAFAVTPSLREWYAEGDLEELEYAALTEAARGSLRLIDADSEAPRRRAVLALDVPEPAAAPAPDLDRAAVRVSAPVPWSQVAAAHVDDPAAEPVVAAAADAVIEADLGDEDAQFTVDEAEGYELQWYATQELPQLVGAAG